MTQMMELPIRAAHAAMLSILKVDARAARESGLNTNWLDFDKKWAMTYNGTAVIRGKCNIAYLEAEIHISMEHFEEGAADDIISQMKSFEKSDKCGALFELTFARVERFSVGEQWGRQPRAGGKAGGKGSS